MIEQLEIGVSAVRNKRYRLTNRYLHCVNGLANEQDNSRNSWFSSGERHRVNGPAVALPNGRKEWWTNGKCIFWIN